MHFYYQIQWLNILLGTCLVFMRHMFDSYKKLVPSQSQLPADFQEEFHLETVEHIV